MPNTKALGFTAAVAALALGLTACGGGGEDGGEGGGGDALQFGYIFPESGDLSFLGPPQIAAAEYAIQEINDAGGVLGTELPGLIGGDPRVALGDPIPRHPDARLVQASDIDVLATGLGVAKATVTQLLGPALADRSIAVEIADAGPVSVDDRRCTLPDKKLVYTEIESLINHFKLIMEGPQVPAGEIYVAHESANGELGFYLVSTGGGTPWKVHVRAPSFVHMGGAHRMLEGYQLADLIPTFGSINMIGGECDR